MNQTRPAACVIGYPAKHSRSPKLHGYWIARYGLDADYRAEDIPPEQFAAFVGQLAAHGYVGANVTMPHKEAALALSVPDARARAIGAANTLWLADGVLHATNTDAEGFLGSLDAVVAGWERTVLRPVVLGAGGAARAVVYGLLERGLERILLVNRTFERAVAMREQFGPAIEPIRWHDLAMTLEGADLLVNTTSLGMEDQPQLDITLTGLTHDALVSDLVYVPLKTRLLAQAEARGLATANGLDMLLHQAVRGFELWFGVRPEVTRELYDLLAADIRAE
jgi:shikimate dehydrogenase